MNRIFASLMFFTYLCKVFITEVEASSRNDLLITEVINQ